MCFRTTDQTVFIRNADFNYSQCYLLYPGHRLAHAVIVPRRSCLSDCVISVKRMNSFIRITKHASLPDGWGKQLLRRISIRVHVSHRLSISLVVSRQDLSWQKS